MIFLFRIVARRDPPDLTSFPNMNIA